MLGTINGKLNIGWVWIEDQMETRGCMNFEFQMDEEFKVGWVRDLEVRWSLNSKSRGYMKVDWRVRNWMSLSSKSRG